VNVTADTRLILGDPPLRTALRIAGLVALVATVAPEAHLGVNGTHLERLVLMVVAVTAWIGWLVARAEDRKVATGTALVCLGAAGGALAPIAPAAIAFSAVAGVGAAMAFDLPVAVMFGAAGPAAHLVAAAAYGHSFTPVAGSAAAAMGGLVIGTSRRQVHEQAEQKAQVAVERERASVEHDRAELLAERNRLAREIHDVLAHTLGALSVQLEALNSGVGTEDSQQLHEGLGQTRRLVTEGLREARRAVTALRDDAAPLPEQLKELCTESGAELSIIGAYRALTPHVALALYRIAQEALTNATKHAPGAPVSVELAFTPGAVRIVVVNAEPVGPSRADTGDGGGYGLQGMRERVLLLGGVFDAGPSAPGWRVEAKLPA
jgi:signal transduction histidine kinase